MSFVEDIKKKQEELRDIYRFEGKKNLSAIIEYLFKTYPDIPNIFWTQYTPYFNDGDVCEFNVHEICVSPAKNMDEFLDLQEEDKWYEYCDGFEYVWKTGYRDNVVYHVPEQQYHDFHQLNSLVNSCPEIFQEAFGDHCQVIVFAPEPGEKIVFHVEDYSHD